MLSQIPLNLIFTCYNHSIIPDILSPESHHRSKLKCSPQYLEFRQVPAHRRILLVDQPLNLINSTNITPNRSKLKT